MACTIDGELAVVFELALDPAAIKERLWRATPICLSIADREQYLREPHDLALRNHQSAERIGSASNEG